MKKLLLFMIGLIVSCWTAMAQTSTYHGTVVDATTGEPLIGASVLPIGGGTGVATNIDGKFTLKVPSTVKEAQISYVGYITSVVPLTNDMEVKLKTSDHALDEVVVVAFGSTTKEAFTGSAAVVNAGDISKHTTSNVANALVGNVPGLQMRGSGGAPGSGNGSISIRGISSLYSTIDPLIIVDGAPYSASLTNISPSDIASVSVLKDAASAALYGARGASGVIIITTKRGANREAEITVDAKWGSTSRAVPEYDVITDPGMYYEAFYRQCYNYANLGQGMSPADANVWANNKMMSDLVYNVYTLPEGQMLIGQDGKLNPAATLGRKYMFNGETRYLIPDNWTDEAYRNGLRQEYNMSINAGNDRSSFYASLNYLDEEGILIPSSYERISGRIRADYQAKNWLKFGANVGYTHSKTNSNPDLSSSSLSAGNIMYAVSSIAPIYPMYVRGYDEAGNPFIYTDAVGNKTYDFGVATYDNASRPFSSPGNPVGGNALDTSKTLGNQLNATLNATIDFTSYLKMDVVSNVNWGQSQATYYGSTYNPLNANVNGKLEKSTTNTIRTNNTQTLTYYNTFGRHSVNIMAGHEYYRQDQNYIWAKGEGGFSPSILELNAFANRAFQAESYNTRYNVEGWFGSAQYNFAEKYYGSASYRRDASSRFAKGHRWGNFWSLGAAWMMSKEDFMAGTKGWLDYLKVKFSIGQQGNDNISSSYAWTDVYNLTVASSILMSPVFNMGFGNPDITWETTTNLNAGLEFGLFNNRLTGNIDFYNKHTKDLLFWLSVPESTGGRGYYGNMGTIRNTGVELSLSGAIVRTRDFDFTLSANFSHNKSKILTLPSAKLGNNGGFYEAPYWYTPGGEMYNYMTLAYAGVNEQGEALYYYDPDLIVDGVMNTSVPGKTKSKEYVTTQSGNASRYVAGSVLPKLFGGFSPSIRYKWIDINANFDFQIGGKVYDSRYAGLMNVTASLDNGAGGSNFHKDIFKAWSPDNLTSDIPRWQLGDTNTAQASDRFLTNAGYLNFASFTVGVTLPKLFDGVSKIRLYCTGENLCFWSARKGLDPRYSFSGNTSIGAYSPIRTINGGIQVQF
ncbi:MAG: SusC/RagA family TonB-linked outer membrane protein [Paramuribaculum sp.]|nr:SusC/RagA family TonB-linked outer membrane protein [Paramuribaculum sp.]